MRQIKFIVLILSVIKATENMGNYLLNEIKKIDNVFSENATDERNGDFQLQNFDNENSNGERSENLLEVADSSNLARNEFEEKGEKAVAGQKITLEGNSNVYSNENQKNDGVVLKEKDLFNPLQEVFNPEMFGSNFLNAENYPFGLVL